VGERWSFAVGDKLRANGIENFRDETLLTARA